MVGTASDRESATMHVRALAEEAREIAERHHLRTLSHLLELVVAEAQLETAMKAVPSDDDPWKPDRSASGTREGPP